MKHRHLYLLLLPLLLSSCGNAPTPTSSDEGSYDSQTIDVTRKSGEIANFKLLSPGNDFVTDSGFTFTWEVCSNADFYQIEIATTKSFINDDPDEVYVKESNLFNPKYELTFSLPKKDRDYFWRVTAINKDHKKKADSDGKFYYKAPVVGELQIEIEDEQDWAVHKEGSQAEVRVDRSNFFNNNKNSLAIVFDKEHTSVGPTSQIGWIVITKSEDRELYGTDAFYFNFYYSGHDSTILIRVLDDDGEYWHKQVQVSNNAKQTILMKYDEFTLRTQGTNIFNRVFDWQHIRYFEIVFERTFGDGVCMLSDIKAVQYDNYKYMFMDKMDFRSDDMDNWTYETYNFLKDVSEDGSSITLTYLNTPTELMDKGFNSFGYGFQNIPLNKYFAAGDAIRMKVKYTGTGPNAVFYFRILEEDNDRWQFKTPFTDLIQDEFKEIVIPLKAFQRMEYMNGDGAKQFYFVQRFNIGLAQNYSEGSLTIKDLEIVKIDDIVEDRTRHVGLDGKIEDFNDYDMYTELYYFWEQSVENKDEAMKLDNIHKAIAPRNTYCAEFDYKADMEMAVYQLYMDTKNVNENFNAFQIWLKDNTPKSQDPAVTYLDPNDIAAEMTIQLTMDSGEWYRYVIDKVEKEWNVYTIKFEDFTLINERDLIDKPNPLSANHIIHMAFGFKYLYYDASGKHHPTYAIANPVYLDEIYLTSATESSVIELDTTIKPDPEDSNITTIETMEGYANSEAMFDYWSYMSDHDYNLMELSNDVSSEGGKNSIKMQYKGYDSVSYGRNTQFAKSVTAKGITLDIKGDGKATVYLNLNWREGTAIFKHRYTISNIPTEWTRFVIGFESFKDVNGSSKALSKDKANLIESISFGIVNSDYTTSSIHVDNIRLRLDVSYNVNTRTQIG